MWAKKYFEVGIGFFAIAQICYSRAFGWKPFNPYAGTVFSVLGFLVFSYLKTSLKGIMVYLVAAYITVICTMAWRAVARVQFFGDLVTWTKLSGCFGALAFVISDLTLAVDRFVCPLPYAHPIIMVTYYAAQFGIALSVVDSQVDDFIASSKRENGHLTNGHIRQPSDSVTKKEIQDVVTLVENTLIQRRVPQNDILRELKTNEIPVMG